MPDYMMALTRRKTAILERKRRLHDDYLKQVAECNHEIADIDKAISMVNEAVKDILCPRCNGSGSIRVCDAAGDMDDERCPSCCGTGIKIEGV